MAVQWGRHTDMPATRTRGRWQQVNLQASMTDSSNIWRINHSIDQIRRLRPVHAPTSHPMDSQPRYRDLQALGRGYNVN